MSLKSQPINDFVPSEMMVHPKRSHALNNSKINCNIIKNKVRRAMYQGTYY